MGQGTNPARPRCLEKSSIPTAKIVYREDAGSWLGYLQEFPDDWTQGDSFEDLEVQLGELYNDLTSGELPGIHRVGDIAVA